MRPSNRPRRLLILANRLPFHRAAGADGVPKWHPSAGGLVAALEPVLQKRPGVWFGWAGVAGAAPRAFTHHGLSIRPVPLSAHEVETFYHGMSNRTFWPLYHDAIRAPEFHRGWWRPYVEVNRRFAEYTAHVARPNDLVWVHDYHLQLVPGMLRARRPDLRIGFFLHIPFPPEELFAWLPWRDEILEGLLGADVIGFQTYANAQNFSRLARTYTSAEGTDTELSFRGRKITVNAFPISIDFDWFNSQASSPRTVRAAQAIRQRIGPNRKILLCVDRIDYTKGIEPRLQAYAELLSRRLASANTAVLMQIAVPSRDSVPDYALTREQIERAVGRINGEYSAPGRVAVHYFRRSFSREELVAYYLAADAMIVTPLRDGMNLVAKEYVACRTDNSGVLVLSEFAGAARELRRAMLVNPRDIDGFVETIDSALRLPPREARTRMSILRTVVRRHDVHDWSARFIQELAP